MPLPTQEVDALNYRNRGKYFDASNFYGSNYQVLMSNDSVTYWTDNVRNLTYQAFHTDSVVRPIDGISKYKIKSITFGAFEYGPESLMNVSYLVRKKRTGSLDELRRSTFSGMADGSNFADVGAGGFVEGGDVIYIEINGVFGQPIKGLNVTIAFIYSN